MEIKNIHTEDGGSFIIKREGKQLAALTYNTCKPGILTIEHTEVSDELRGQHIGQKLVASAVAFAIEKDLKINPICPFAHAVLKKNNEYKILLIEE